MSDFRWDKILQRWSEAILDSVEPSVLPEGALERKWVGNPPATDAQIDAAEERLQCRLPPSYREFLKITNGWPYVSDFVRQLWPIESVRPLAESQTGMVDAFSKVPELDSAKLGESATLPSSHYAHVIQISDYDDGCFFLNPLVQTTGDECQACFFANWVPGAECYRSFKDLILSQYESFVAAHPARSSNGGARAQRRNLRKPPEVTTEDPVAFLAELEKLGFFRYSPPEKAAQVRHAFLTLATAIKQDPTGAVGGRLASPGTALFTNSTRRVAAVDPEELLRGRAAYALSRLRPILAATGIELAPVEELGTSDLYVAKLEGVEHEFFALVDGQPAREGGLVPINAARFYMEETAKLVTKVLRKRKSPERVATLQEMTKSSGVTRLALVLLDDELSYLIQWSPLLDNFCRPIRPDVW